MILTTTEFSLGQTTAISEKDYWAGIFSGYAATRDLFPRRETETHEGRTGGKVIYSRTEISEFLSKNTYRYTKTIVRDGTTDVTEAIQIGSTRYCRENASEWKRSGCYQQPPPPLDDSDEIKCFINTNKDIRTYIRTATLLKKDADKAHPTKFLTEDRFVLNSNGAVGERSIIKMVDGTKSIVSRETSKFEYGISLTPIEAPTK